MMVGGGRGFRVFYSILISGILIIEFCFGILFEFIFGFVLVVLLEEFLGGNFSWG